MKTSRLLFAITWRGGAWGLLVGAILGAAFGAIFAGKLFDLGLVEQSGAIPSSDYPPAIADFMAGFLALLGGIVGGGVGMPIGWMVGASDGFLIGMLLRASTDPMGKIRINRSVLFTISMLYTSVASLLGFIVILRFYSTQSAATSLWLLAIVIVPSLIAGIALGFVSQLLVLWYEREVRR
ncbi:MAG: hypothetical protein HZB51_24130 [Chloroflexi bacterium]|nr:hypothetical protein [Chloroflexota bacterium]